MWDNFFFVGLPYISLVLFFGGLIYRGFSNFMSAYRGKWTWSSRGDFYWSVRTTGFFGRASIGPASLCIHWGIIFLFFTHLIGFIGGAYNWSGWVTFFRWVGMAAGLVFLYGLIWALIRRISIPQLKAISTMEDYLILIFLIVITALGLWQSMIELVFGVAFSVGPWIASIFKLQPDPSLISGAPLINKLHMIIAMLFFAWFPFTKLVHFASFPFDYLTRPFISMRRFKALKK